MLILKRNRNRGKAAERAVAEILGGIRAGVLGKEDVIHPRYSIEVKSRKTFTATKWMEQSTKNAGAKIPLVVVHVAGKRHGDSLVIMRMRDFSLTEKNRGE